MHYSEARPSKEISLSELREVANWLSTRGDVGKLASASVTEAANELERRRAAETFGDWQPIETAPRNGKWVLLWWPGITDWEGYLEGGRIGAPIYWQPLPAPPPEKSNEKPSASTGDGASSGRNAPTSSVECPKCRTQLAFEGDECGLCEEEA